MHCADICLSATHNESARKLVMTQFEPCQYRHKSRYASVLQNRCFYTYIWLAYLVRFFERLLRQTTPKLLPLFECLPLLFLLMSLRYSVRPNIFGTMRGLRRIDDHGQEGSEGALQWDNPESTSLGPALTAGSGNTSSDISFSADRVSSLFGTAVTVQTASIRFLCLIRAYES